jgi:hypothetical protein
MSPQPYVPDTLPLSNLDYRLLLPLVGQANAALARYATLRHFVEPKIGIRLHKPTCRYFRLHNEGPPT